MNFLSSLMEVRNLLSSSYWKIVFVLVFVDRYTRKESITIMLLDKEMIWSNIVVGCIRNDSELLVETLSVVIGACI